MMESVHEYQATVKVKEGEDEMVDNIEMTTTTSSVGLLVSRRPRIKLAMHETSSRCQEAVNFM